MLVLAWLVSVMARGRMAGSTSGMSENFEVCSGIATLLLLSCRTACVAFRAPKENVRLDPSREKPDGVVGTGGGAGAFRGLLDG